MSARSSTSSQHTPSWSWSFFWTFSKTYPGLIKSYPHSCLDRAQYEDGFLLETLPCFLSASHKRQHDQTLLTTVQSSSKHHKKKLACEWYFLRHLFSRSSSLTRLESKDWNCLEYHYHYMLQYHVSQVEKSGAQYCQHHKNNYKYASYCWMSILKPTQNQVSSSPKLSRWVQLEVVRPKVTNFNLKKKQKTQTREQNVIILVWIEILSL